MNSRKLSYVELASELRSIAAFGYWWNKSDDAHDQARSLLRDAAAALAQQAQPDSNCSGCGYAGGRWNRTCGYCDKREFLDEIPRASSGSRTAYQIGHSDGVDDGMALAKQAQPEINRCDAAEAPGEVGSLSPSSPAEVRNEPGAQPEIPTREMIAEVCLQWDHARIPEDALREADAVLALFAPKETT